MSASEGAAWSASTKGRSGPIITPETTFFWEGARQRRLLVQQCSSCATPRHPPGPACPRCHSLEWEAVEQERTGTLHSFTVQHHPLPAGFESPCAIGLIEFSDGTRLVSNIVDVDPEELVIGEPLEVFFVDQDEGWTAPQLRRPTPG